MIIIENASFLSPNFVYEMQREMTAVLTSVWSVCVLPCSTSVYVSMQNTQRCLHLPLDVLQ